MSVAENILAVVILVALPLRFVLDFASITAPRSNLDAAYAALFFVVGVAMVVADPASYWGYIAFIISAWSLFSFIRKRKTGTNVSAKKENT